MVSVEWLERIGRSYVRHDLDIDILCLDDWVRWWLVQAERVIIMVQLAPFGLLGLVLDDSTRSFPLLAYDRIIKGRPVLAIADL